MSQETDGGGAAVIPLRPVPTEQMVAYCSLAIETFTPIGTALLQLRKVGVTVRLPDAVRQPMLAAHGQDAARLLALIDGRVSGML